MTRFTWLGMAALALILTGSTAVSNDESPADEADPVVQDRVTGLRQGGQAQRAPRGQRPPVGVHRQGPGYPRTPGSAFAASPPRSGDAETPRRRDA